MAGQKTIDQGRERRRAILRFLRRFVERKGYSPSIQEIADAVGLVSPNATRNHLQVLQAEGFITLTPRLPRAIIVVEPGPDGWTRARPGEPRRRTDF